MIIKQDLLQSEKLIQNNYQNLLRVLNQSIDALSIKSDFEEQKLKVLDDLLNAFKKFKHTEFESSKARKIVKKQIKNRIVNEENIYLRLKKLILLREKDRTTRENSIKLLKKIICFSKKSIQNIIKLKIEVFISFILEREYKHVQVENERKQCFKFIQAWLEKDNKTFPYIFGQSIASIAKNPEDQLLRKQAIELILILSQKRPDMTAGVGGIQIMVNTLLDIGTFRQGIIRYDLIVHSLLLMINSPASRIYLRHFKDLNRIFSIFTQADGVDKDPQKDVQEKLQLQLNLVSNEIVNMMRNNNGLIYITSSPLGLTSLIAALNQPIKEFKKLAILNLFIEIFDVPLQVGGNIYLSSFSASQGQSQNLLNNYVALLLLAFYHCGIYEALIKVSIGTEEQQELNLKSRFLLKKIMYLSSNLLPEVPQIASLVNIATDFDQNQTSLYYDSNLMSSSDESINRNRATKIIKELSEISLRNPLEVQKDDQFFMQNIKMFQMNTLFLQNFQLMQNPFLGQRDETQFKDKNYDINIQNNINSITDFQSQNEFPEFFMKTFQFFNNLTYGQNIYNQQIQSNFQLDLQQYYYSQFFDNIKFEKKVQMTNVLKSKDYKDWNFKILLELFDKDGILWNQEQRMDQYMEGTKFFKRLLSFYMPSKERFVNLEWKQENLIYAQVGYLMLKTLLKTNIGKKALIGPNLELIMTPGLVMVDTDNPFHQKKSFIQDLEQFIEKEFRRYEKIQEKLRIINQQNSNEYSKNESQQYCKTEEDGQNTVNIHKFQYDKRFMSKHRLNCTMFREMISWIGLFTSNSEILRIIQKKNERNSAQKINLANNNVDGPSTDRQNQLQNQNKKKKKDDNIFYYLMGLADRNGFYDHLLQIVLYSFDFSINLSPAREILKEWCGKCSPNFSKSIMEAFRQQHRQGNLDFYSWCLPLLCNFLLKEDEDIQRCALSVLEEACFDEVSINFLLEDKNIHRIINKQYQYLQQEQQFTNGLQDQNSISFKEVQSMDLFLNNDIDIFITKFLRSEKGYKILKEKGWIDYKIKNWNQMGGKDYMTKLEKNIYDGLSINKLNSLVKTYAMSIWIPIYEHSSDFRNEISTLKKFPFQIIVKIEDENENLIKEQETLQTYIEIENFSNSVQSQQVQIIGIVTKQFSRLSKFPIKSNYVISACVKLGNKYVDNYCKETDQPYWIKTDVGEQAKTEYQDLQESGQNIVIPRFKIIKNGVHYQFKKDFVELGDELQFQQDQFDKNQSGKFENSFLKQEQQYRQKLQTFLENIIFKVQIQPQKYKTIETPVHLFGELVKTNLGTDFIRKRNYVQEFKQCLFDEKQNVSIQEKRSILWTLGHLGSHQNGIQLIMEASLIKDIIDMAENSEILSLRGTCIYTIGMICKTKIGRSEVQKHNWIYSQSQVVCSSDTVCLPRDPKKLFQVNGGQFQGSIVCQKHIVKCMKDIKINIPLNKEEQEILDLIGSLINGVTWLQAYNELQKAQEKKPKMFLNPRLFEHVILYLSVYNRMQPKTRKFIFNLFDQLIFQNKILKERFVNI